MLHACNKTTACAAKRRDDWVKKCMEYEVEGSRPTGRPKRVSKRTVKYVN